jgi:hypothetical protein
MAMARREQQRTHAIDIASATNCDPKKRIDWERFIKTGSMKETEPPLIPMTPLIQHHVDRIKANGGRLVWENN